MKICLNGKNIETSSKTLMALVSKKGFDLKSLVAEVNFKVVKQDEWECVQIKDGDKIELLSFVGGG
jgi:sulfur carrier protein